MLIQFPELSQPENELLFWGCLRGHIDAAKILGELLDIADTLRWTDSSSMKAPAIWVHATAELDSHCR